MSFAPDRDGAMLVYGTSGLGQVDAAAHDRHRGRRCGPTSAPCDVYGARLRRGCAAVARVAAARRLGHRGRRRRAGPAPAAHARRACSIDRAKAFSEADAASLSRVPRITGIREPRILLLIDGFAQFKQDWELDDGAHALLQRSSCGSSARAARSACTSSPPPTARARCPTAVSANVTKRIVLRLCDESAYQVLGVPKDVLGERSAPGRAIVEGLETQVAVLGGTAERRRAVDGARSGRRAAARGRSAGGARDRRAPDVVVAGAELPDRRARHARARPRRRHARADRLRARRHLRRHRAAAERQDERRCGRSSTRCARFDPARAALPPRRPACPARRRTPPWMRSATSVDEVKVAREGARRRRRRRRRCPAAS